MDETAPTLVVVGHRPSEEVGVRENAGGKMNPEVAYADGVVEVRRLLGGANAPDA
jgi:hypothetical protein